MPNIPGIENLNVFAGISSIMYWVGYILLIVLILGALVAVYLIMGYKYKVTVLERRGLGRAGKEDHAIGKVIKDRAKEVKEGGVTKWRFLFSRKTIAPPDYKCVYPGNRLFLYRSGKEDYYPLLLNCKEGNGEMVPMPEHIRRWQQQEIQQAAEDYTKKTFMQQYGNMVIMMGTVIFCLILVGVTVYYTYQHANGVTNALGALTGTLGRMNNIPGI